LSRLNTVRRACKKLVAFEVADTDRISNKAVALANECDLIIVPSRFSKYAFISSGVRAKVEVVPHGVSKEFFDEKKLPQSPQLRSLLFKKSSGNYIYVLYFLMHSGFRKGADLVYTVMKEIQRRHDNVILVVKRDINPDPYMNLLRRLRLFEVAGWLSERELVALYDMCDVCVVPSRGGGFELNAIESLARGLPTLVPRWGCFLDYVEYAIPLEIETYEQVFKLNEEAYRVHQGLGCKVSVLDFYVKLEHVINNLEDYKQVFEKRAHAIRRIFSWENIGKKIVDVFKKYGVSL